MEQKKEQQPNKTSEQGKYPPPAEGRTDIGEEQGSSQQTAKQQGAGAVTGAPDPVLNSKEPAEGRTDVAKSRKQEEQQAYSPSAHDETDSQ